MKKLALGLGVLMVFFSFNVSFAASFSDVSNSTKYAHSINWMADNGVINGDPAGTFRPSDCTNRAEFLKMLFLADGRQPLANVQAPFSDLDKKSWYYPYVTTAYAAKMVNGYADGTFRPTQCVNRMEALKMAVLQFTGGVKPIVAGSLEGDFKGEWFYDYLNFAAYANLAFEELRYQVGGEMSRQEVAELLFRLKAVFDHRRDSADYSRYFYTKNYLPKALVTDDDGKVSFVNDAFDYSFKYDGKALLAGNSGVGISYYPEVSRKIYLDYPDNKKIKLFVHNQSASGDYVGLYGKNLEDFVTAIWLHNTQAKSSSNVDVVLSQIFKKDFNGITWIGFSIEGAFGYTGFGGLLEEPKTIYYARRGDNYFEIRADKSAEPEVESILRSFKF